MNSIMNSIANSFIIMSLFRHSYHGNNVDSLNTYTTNTCSTTKNGETIVVIELQYETVAELVTHILYNLHKIYKVNSI